MMSQRNEQPGVVIVGGSFHSLGAARNLAEHGVPVFVLDSGVCISRFSRRVERFIKCPSVGDEARFVEFLLRIAEEEHLNGWALFPSTDESVRALALHWERLSGHYRLTLPPWETVRFLYDKWLTHQLAQERGVPVPATHRPENASDLASMNLDFPLVIKPTVSKQFMAATKKKAFRANNQEELARLYEQAAAVMEPSEILIQELIPGGTKNLYSFVGYFRDGVPIAGLSAHRIRQHPMEFGRASTYVETVQLPELERLATQLLTGLAYTGLAEVEFMWDEKGGRFVLLEVNPRIWGWHTIAIRAGLELPYLTYAGAIGLEVPVGSAREDVKWVRLVTDIPTALSEMLSGRLTVREYVASMSGDIGDAVLSLSDPLPFFADLLVAAHNYLLNKGF
jgi:D-aspartate ligase